MPRIQKILTGTSIGLAILLGFLAWQRLTAKPPPAPSPVAEGNLVTAEAKVEVKAEPKVESKVETKVEPKSESKVEAKVQAKAEPKVEPRAEPKRAEAGPKAEAKPKPEPARPAGRKEPDAAAMAAIFSDRPVRSGASLEEVGRRLAAARAMRQQASVPSLSRAQPPGATARTAAATVRARPQRPAAPAVAAAPALPAAITGHVRTASGGPVAGATILALASDAEEAYEATSDDEGFFLVAAVRPGRYVLFPGLGTPLASVLPARSVEVPAGAVTRVELQEASSGATVHVRTLRTDGLPTPAQSLLVSGSLASPGSLPGLLATSAIFQPEKGDFDSVLRKVPAGTYTVVILEAGRSLPRILREPVTVSGSGEQTIDVFLPRDVAAGAGRPAG